MNDIQREADPGPGPELRNVPSEENTCNGGEGEKKNTEHFASDSAALESESHCQSADGHEGNYDDGDGAADLQRFEKSVAASQKKRLEGNETCEQDTENSKDQLDDLHNIIPFE